MTTNCSLKNLSLFIVIILLFLPTLSFATDYSPQTMLNFLGTKHTPTVSLLPEYFTVTDDFKTITASPAGSVLQVEGTAYVYHQGETTAYTLTENLPLFTGDTLITDDASSLSLQMIDNSTLVLASQTKLTINKVEDRSKFGDIILHFFFGRIRALVEKFSGDYTIMTQNVFVGIRGTDFALAVAPAPQNGPHPHHNIYPEYLTAVLTGGKQSTVELTGGFGPSTLIKPYSMAAARTGEQAGKAVYVGSVATALLNNIAPLPKQSNNPQPPPNQQSQGDGPCWPFPGKQGTLSFFMICD